LGEVKAKRGLWELNKGEGKSCTCSPRPRKWGRTKPICLKCTDIRVDFGKVVGHEERGGGESIWKETSPDKARGAGEKETNYIGGCEALFNKGGGREPEKVVHLFGEGTAHLGEKREWALMRVGVRTLHKKLKTRGRNIANHSEMDV